MSSSGFGEKQPQTPQHVLAVEEPPRRMVPIVTPVGTCLKDRSDSGRSESGAIESV